MSEEGDYLQPILFAADSPAKTSRWLDAVLDWLASDPDCSTISLASLAKHLPAWFLSKTSLDCSPLGVLLTPRRVSFSLDSDGSVTKEVISPSSCPAWSKSGMAWPGGVLTLNTAVWHSGASVSSLSDVLETCEVPQKYYLSPLAARGILRRAEKRGKTLPPRLDWYDAGEKSGLSKRQILSIQAAADGRPHHNRHLRKRLLEACGIVAAGA